MDEHQRIIREAEVKKKAEREAQVTLESRKLLYLVSNLKRIQNEAVDMLSQYWLELVVSFKLQNTQDLQMDMPITLKAFKFCSFVKVANVPSTDSDADHLLFSFYLKHMKPQYETQSASKITTVKVTCPIETDSFPNAKLKVVRGYASQVHEFTLVDLPCLNPYVWIMLYNLLVKDGQKYEPIISHLNLMIVLYVQEVGKMDVEIAVVLRRKPSVLPKEAPKGFEKLKLSKIYKEGWYVVFQARERNDADFHKACFFPPNKHLYTTSCLVYILDIVNKYKGNSKGERKCFSDMIQWYIQVRKTLLSIIPKVFEVQKGTQL